MKQPLRVGVTGGAGNICYSLLFRIASGELFGLDQPIILHILELKSALQQLTGVVMELHDCAFPLLHQIVTGDDPNQVFEGVDFAFLVGAKPRGKGMERGDLLQENAQIFVNQAKALNRKDVKVLVIGNPANTNALVLSHNAPNLPVLNIRSMMRLDQNRALYQIAKKTGVSVQEVKKLAVYGNHSPTMVVDYTNATIAGQPLQKVVGDDGWLRGEFSQTVGVRGAKIIEARGLSSAASAANAALDSIRDWVVKTPKDDWYSAGVYSENNPYGIDGDLFFSFALQNTEIVKDLQFDDDLIEKIKATEKELIEERNAVKRFL